VDKTNKPDGKRNSTTKAARLVDRC
jgi:hypothetical protein